MEEKYLLNYFRLYFSCSLNCYKTHKDSPECLEKDNAKLNEIEDMLETNECDEPTVHEPFKTEDTVPQEKLKSLGKFSSKQYAPGQWKRKSCTAIYGLYYLLSINVHYDRSMLLLVILFNVM